MEQTKKKKKAGVIITICSTAFVLVLGASVILPLIIAKGNANPPRLFEKKYVSEYDLDYGETAYKVYTKWNVRKYKPNNGSKYLDVWYSGEKSTAREHLRFRVFDSSSQAKRAFKNMYESYEDYRGIDEEGDNWFAGWEPGVCDASIYSMVYIEDNVLIMAELEIIGEWPVIVSDEDDTVITPEPVRTGFDSGTLKAYVIDNSEDLKNFVLNRVLGF